MRLLLDTNILIDYFGRREPYFEACCTLRIAEAFGDVELWASAKSFTDVFYVLKKYVSPAAIQQAFAKSRSFLKVASLTDEDVYRAASREWDDFEDCLIAVTAENIAADRIITRDKAGFARSKVPAMTADEFVAWLQDEKSCSYAEVHFTSEEIEAAKKESEHPQTEQQD